MVSPKYRFYIGKAVSFELRDNYAINSYTGELNDLPGYMASLPASIDAEKIYANYSITKKTKIFINQYIDSSFSYGNTTAISNVGVYTLKAGTTEIAVELRGFSDRARKNIIKSGFSEIYALTPVTPHYKELTKKYSKENNQMFFRTTLSGKISLYADDYKLISSASIDDSFLLLVEKQNATTGEWYEYYKAQFSKTDCKFDYGLRKCELKLTALDRYSKVLDAYENTYDLVKLAPAITPIEMYKRSILQIYVKGENTISNYFGGTYWESDVNEAIDNETDLVNKYYFSYLHSANEFTIQGATTYPEVNGVYAGVNGVWKNKKGYTCVFNSTGYNDFQFMKIIRDRDNEVLYITDIPYSVDNPDDIFITQKIAFRPTDSEDLVTTEFTIEPILYKFYQRLLCDVDSVYDMTTYDLPVDDFVSDNRNFKKCIGISSGYVYCSSEFSDEPTKYGVNDLGQYFTNKAIYEETGLRPYPVCRNSWANSSLWYAYNDTEYAYWEEGLRKKYTLKDSYSVGAVIKSLLAEIDPLISHEETAEYSQFLYGGEQIAPLKWDNFYVYLTQKSNILKGQYDQAAQKAETQLKDILDMLRDCFRCYWYIDDYKLKIEHVSYFLKGGSYSSSMESQLDLTTLKDQFNKMSAAYFQTQIEYDKSDLNQRYEFNWMDDVTELFGPITLDVRANYIQKGKIEEININNFSSDVDFMLFNSSEFSEDGFALLCPIKNSEGKLELPIIENSIIDESGRNYKANAQNWYAAWPYLVGFYKYDLPGYNVDVDVLATDFNVYGIKRCMEHIVNIHTEEDLDELKLITTTTGPGVIEEMSINLGTRLAEIKLVYEPK